MEFTNKITSTKGSRAFYGDATWAQWRLNQQPFCMLFQQMVHTYSKENIKAGHSWEEITA